LRMNFEGCSRTGVEMAQSETSLDIAWKIAEARYAEVRSRFDTLNQKLGAYVAAIAIITSVVALFIQEVLSKEGQILGYCNLLCRSPALRTCLFFSILLSLGLTLMGVIFASIRVVQGLTPVVLQEVDDEALILAMKGKTLDAKRVYVTDLASATEANKEAIRKRFSLLYSINRWLVWTVIAQAILLAANTLFLVLN
jgi:hypothetical protein